MATKIRGSNFSPSATTTITSIVTENSVDSALVTNLIDSAYIIARASTYDSDNFAGQLAAATTADLSEGSNLYYTTARFDSDFGDNTTSDLTEGSNLYYTTARFDSDFGDNTTSDLTEGSNLYYTNTRADARIAAASITDLSDADQTVRTTDNVSFADVTLTGALNGPSTFYIDPAPVDSDAGLLVIRGDLQVDGTTTTVNSTTVSINDKNIVLADSAANASEADGAGITVNGASATIQYDAVADAWDFNKDVDITGTVTADDAVYVEGASPRLQIQDTDGTLQYSFLQQSAGTTILRLRNDTSNGAFSVAGYGAGSTTTRFNIATNGDISFYDNTGVTQGLFWDASTQRLGLGTTSPSYPLAIYVSDTNANFGIQAHSTTPGSYNQASLRFGLSSASSTTLNWDVNAEQTGFTFDYEGSEKFRITSGGNVGIGTTSPVAPLDVKGSGTLGYSASGDDIPDGARINLWHNNNDHMIGMGSGGMFFTGNTNIRFDYKSGTSVNNGVSRLFLDMANGRVGIGTSGPAYKLDVNGGSTTTPIAHIETTNTGDSVVLSLDSSSGFAAGGGTRMRFGRHTQGANSVEIGYDHDTAGFQVTRNGADLMTITSSGRVGIGTSSPSQKLEISENSVDGAFIVVNNPDAATTNDDLTIGMGGSSAFSITGWQNAGIIEGTSTGGLWLGAYNGPLKFATGSSSRVERMRIDSSGNVGIGKTSPSYSLDVAGAVMTNTSETIDPDGMPYGAGVGYIADGSGWGAVGLAFSQGNAGDTGAIGFASNSMYFALGDGTNPNSFKTMLRMRRNIFEFNDDGLDTDFRFESTGNTHMLFIDAGNDRVGIGTASPTNTLDIGFADLGNAAISFRSSTYAQIAKIVGSHDSGTAEGSLRFHTRTGGNEPERMRIDSSGNVGIGVSTPSGKLHLSESGAVNQAAMIFSLDGYHSTFGANLAKSSGTYTTPATNISGGAWEYRGANSLNAHGTMVYLSAPDTNSSASTPVERMRIDSLGNVGIGTASPDSVLHVADGTSTALDDSRYKLKVESSGEAYISVASDTYAGLRFPDSTNVSRAYVDYYHGVDSMVFGVNGGERMRINSSGHLLLNTTSHNFSTTQPIQEIYTPGASNGGLSIRSQQSSSQAYHALGLWTGANGSTSTGYAVSFYHGSGGVNEGTISVTSAGVTYNTTSDYRLKENIEIIADAKERLLALKPVRHSWKDAPETTVDGFIAHEVQEAGFEYAVTGEKDAEDMQSMDYGRITPVIVAALQDALKEIDMLKDRIAELEAK